MLVSLRALGRLLTRPRVCRLLAVALVLVILAGLQGLPSGDNAMAGDKGEKKFRQAPELTGGSDWINTAGPIDLADLKGRIVVLDFWTLCCINCIHTLPDLAKLEARYPGILVIIGVHSPKFEHEKNSDAIRKAVLKYEIKHPVVNDADHKIWKRYGVRSWPTLVVIDPEGNLIAKGAGEGLHDALDRVITELIKEHRAKKTLKETPLDFKLAKEKERTPLFFPGKVFGDAASNRLFIADSTHHRIVVTDLDGKKIAVAGSGVEGYKDGPFESAQFSDPQGMALVGDTLYVADRKNHLIRGLDLKKQTVSTVAGTGEQDRRGRFLGGDALKTGLNSPWDLLVAKNKMYVAMAGHHQIWIYDFKEKTIEPFAGSGSEDIEDGPFDRASFAQPSGLATDGTNLFVADSETSSIRSLPLSGKGEVTSIVGEGLFDFGDKEGTGKDVRLQHPMAVAYYKGLLYVADTYNNKIKVIDPKTKECVNFRGTGWKGNVLDEPGGLCVIGDKLYIADTNNHRIQIVDFRSRALATLGLTGVTPPAREMAKGK
ncbi:MAG: redoxin domain-containing protein [Gemmataceae bacterium]